jgi:hypothetical protein
MSPEDGAARETKREDEYLQIQFKYVGHLGPMGILSKVPRQKYQKREWLGDVQRSQAPNEIEIDLYAAYSEKLDCK